MPPHAHLPFPAEKPRKNLRAARLWAGPEPNALLIPKKLIKTGIQRPVPSAASFGMQSARIPMKLVAGCVKRVCVDRVLIGQPSKQFGM